MEHSEYELRFPGQEWGRNESQVTHLDVIIHVAGGISYNHKGALIFYNDPVEPLEKQRAPTKPKQMKYELDGAFQERIKVFNNWKKGQDATPKGNYMTQVFYA